MNFRPMVNVGRGEWVGNALVFATHAEALANVMDLMSRWMQVVDTRVDETSAPVNYSWVDGRLVRIGEQVS
jgi:hypothetical protein